MTIKYSKEIIHSFIIIFLFFIVSAFTKEIYSELLFATLSVYVVLFSFYMRVTKTILIVFFIFISLLLVPVIIGSSGVRPGNWLGLAITFMAYFFFADYLNKRPYISLHLSKLLFFSYLIFLTVLFVISYTNNVNYGEYINKLFMNKSRNVVIYFCFILCVFYLFNIIQNRKKINLISLLSFCFFCLISGSRTALILSTLIFAICLITNKKALYLLTFISILILISLNNIEAYILSNTNFNQGLETPRTLMYNEYINNLDFSNFMLGMNFELLPTVLQFGSNPHNSFIYINMLFGFNIIIYVLFLIYSLYRYFKVDSKLAAIFFILILRLSLDTVSYNLFFTDIFVLYLIMNSFPQKKQFHIIDDKPH